ncbi:MAG: tetratricopeptide repeat protein [Pyrinomonadaceae bacterium]
MKRCPKCAKNYYDEALNFCLDDGEWLTGDASESPTVSMSAAEVPTRAFATAGNVQHAESSSVRSIAVLPFAHLSSDVDDEYFCDGLAEELLNGLSRLDGLKVAARTSAFSFKGKHINVAEIGRSLGVATVLEGSVRKSGGRVRINAQLINAADGFHLWSGQYDREMRDVFALQDEIRDAVVDALKMKLLGVEDESAPMDALINELQNYSRDLESYQLFLRGRFFLNKFNTDDAFKAVELFSKAIELDPASAQAYAGLAVAHIMLTEMGPVPPHDAMPKAREAALRAIDLDESLPEAHSSLGMVLQIYDYDFSGAERQFLRAIELNPNNPVPRQAYGVLLTELERHEEAEKQFQKMLEVDPLSVVGNWIYSFCLFLSRRYDESLEWAKQTLELDPNFGVAYLSVAFAHQMKGQYEESAEAYARCNEVMGSPENAAFIRESYKAGWENFLRAMTGDKRPIAFSSYIVAVFYAALGDVDGAFSRLEASLKKRESHIVMVKVDPRFDSMRSDVRYAKLLRDIGFSE